MGTALGVVAVALIIGAMPPPAGAGAGDGRRALSVGLLPAPPGADEDHLTPTQPSQRYPYLIPRSDQDRPDEREGQLLHVVYLLPADASDDGLDELGILEDSLRSQNAWFEEQSGGLRWRLDTFTFLWEDPAAPEDDPVEVEAVDVTFIRSELSGEQLNDAFEVEEELTGRGLAEEDKRYLSYVASDGDGFCGDSIISLNPPTDPPDGKYAQVYLDSVPGCRARDFAPDARSPSFSEAIAQHEVIHNEGLVWPSAPHHCWGFNFHVCTVPLVLTGLDPELVDVMFPSVGPPLADRVLDRGRDDYFGHPFPWGDLDESVYLESGG